MNDDPQYDEIRWKVERRFKERLGVIIHALLFVPLNLMFWGMWLFVSPSSSTAISPGAPPVTTPVDLGFPWPLIITLGWGVGLVAHLMTYYYQYGPGAALREDAIKREVEREMARRHGDSYMEKPKRDRQVQLTEDGELEEVAEDESNGRKRHNRR
jgi:hypothetical protein